MPDIHYTRPDTGTPPVRHFDASTPSPAGIYDCLLGGKDNFAADRAAAREIETRLPNVRSMMVANRRFLGRAVRYLAGECGIRQFIDIGSGLPSQGNVHEIAQGIAPETRVVYVDNDPVVLNHGRAILAANDDTAVLTADLRDPASILRNPVLRQLIDPREPVAVLTIAVLHFIRDEEKPLHLVNALRMWMPPGSYIALSHIDRTPEVESAAEVYDQATSPGVPRSRDEVLKFFDGFELVEPGLVPVSAWSTDREAVDEAAVPWWGGVARLPGAEVCNV